MEKVPGMKPQPWGSHPLLLASWDRETGHSNGVPCLVKGWWDMTIWFETGSHGGHASLEIASIF